MTTPVPTVSAELKAVLRQVKLGRCLDTLPERLALAKQRSMGHAEFLELVMSDEVTRRDHVGGSPVQKRWPRSRHVPRAVGRNHQGELRPSGLGRALLASVHRSRSQRDDHGPRRSRKNLHGLCSWTRSRPSALQRGVLPDRHLVEAAQSESIGNSHEAEIRKLMRVDLLILDDFALQPFDALDTADVYELVVERHRVASTLVTSNREPIEWIGQMTDALLAQSAIDRLQSAAYELVLDGESYRRRQKPGLDVGGTTPRTPRRRRRS